MSELKIYTIVEFPLEDSTAAIHLFPSKNTIWQNVITFSPLKSIDSLERAL